MLMICITLLVASCREQQQPKQQALAVFHAIADNSSKQYYTVRQLFRQFDFNLTAIYGDVFSNKAWH